MDKREWISEARPRLEALLTWGRDRVNLAICEGLTFNDRDVLSLQRDMRSHLGYDGESCNTSAMSTCV